MQANQIVRSPGSRGIGLAKISVAGRSSSKEGGLQKDFFWTNLVPRVFSLSNMEAAGEKTLANSRNHVTDLCTESGNLFKMASKIKSEKI